MLIFYFMRRPIIKVLADFGPLLVFFVMYFKNDQDLKIAIPPFVIATLLSLIIIYIGRMSSPT